MRIATLLSIVLALSASLNGMAQGTSVAVFTEMGENFTLYLNGQKQNETPTNSILIPDVTSEFYLARIDFEDPDLGDFSHNNFAVQLGMMNNYVIKQNRKGKYVIRYFAGGSVPTPPTTSSPSPQTQVTTTAPATGVSTTLQTEENVSIGTTMNTGGVSTTTTTTTTTTSGGGTEQVKVDMNVGGAGIKLDMSVPDMGMDTQMTTSTTVTETSSTTTTSTGTPPAPAAPAEMTVADCGISPMDFNTMKGSIQSKTFEDSKETLARQAIRGKCPTSQQVHDIMKIFEFEETRLEFAKYAYDLVSDSGNYYLVNNAFEFELSIDELEEFLQDK